MKRTLPTDEKVVMEQQPGENELVPGKKYKATDFEGSAPVLDEIEEHPQRKTTGQTYAINVGMPFTFKGTLKTPIPNSRLQNAPVPLINWGKSLCQLTYSELLRMKPLRIP